MEWCRCSKCNHKLFLYEPSVYNYIHLNIKCSSCKKILDVDIIAEEVKVNESKA